MTADVVAACREQIVLQKAFAAAERDQSPTMFGRKVATQHVAALDAFTAILDLHQNFAPSLHDRCRVCHVGVPCPTVRIIAERLGVPVDDQL